MGSSVTISLIGDSDIEHARKLLSWLKRENLAVSYLGLKQNATADDQMGGEYLPVIAAMAASPIVIEVLKSIVEWLRANRPKIEVEILTEKGHKIRLSASSLNDVHVILKRIEEEI